MRRSVDQQLGQVVALVYPGPLARRAAEWTPSDRERAQRLIQRALDNWYTRHGVGDRPDRNDSSKP